MTNERRAICIALGIAMAWAVFSHPVTRLTNVPAPPVRRPGWFDDVDIQLIKIDLFAKQLDEARANLKRVEDQANHQVTFHSTPLLETDITPTLKAPLVQTSLLSQPAAVTPGMEPSKEQTPSVPVQTPIRASAGHWEAYGFRGRQRRWVSDYSVPVSQAAPQRSGIPVLRRFGSCRGGSCGG